VLTVPPQWLCTVLLAIIGLWAVCSALEAGRPRAPTAHADPSIDVRLRGGLVSPRLMVAGGRAQSIWRRW
jgi:hypothetical protein